MTPMINYEMQMSMKYLDTLIHNMFINLNTDYKYDNPEISRPDSEEDKYYQSKYVKLLMIKDFLYQNINDPNLISIM